MLRLPCDIHLTGLECLTVVIGLYGGARRLTYSGRYVVDSSPRRPFQRQSRTSAHLRLVSARMVRSLAMVTRAPSSTALSRTSCEFLVRCFADIHLISSCQDPRR